MTAASGVTAAVLLDHVPVLPAAREYLREGIAPGGTHANWRFLNDWVRYADGVGKEDQLLLCDAQTSGGLLAAVPAEHTDALPAKLKANGVPVSAVIDRIREGQGRRIVVSSSRTQTA
jgi:selenide,water dikinase